MNGYGLGAGRRRWTVRCRDLLCRPALLVIEVDPAGGVCLHLPHAAVLDLTDVVRLQRRLADAAACALADGAGWPAPDPELVTVRISSGGLAALRRMAAAECDGDLARLLLQLAAEAIRARRARG